MTHNDMENVAVIERFTSGIEHIRDKGLGRLGLLGAFQQNPEVETLGLPQTNGLYATPGPLLDCIEGLHPNRLSFSLASAREVGRQDSRNGVFFGDLTLRSFGENHTRTIPVAIKPFVGAEKQQYLINELRAIEDIKQAGLEGVKPLGVFRDGEFSYLISLFEQKVISLDSIDWDKLSPELQTQTIRRGLLSLLELHANGRAHGDANPRNITIQPDLTANWHVDLEHSQATEEPAKLLVGIKRDLLDYFTGLCKLRKEKVDYERLVDQILVPYSQLATLLKSESTGARLVAKLLPALAVELERELNGEPVKPQERNHIVASLGL